MDKYTSLDKDDHKLPTLESSIKHLRIKKLQNSHQQTGSNHRPDISIKINGQDDEVSE